VPRTRFFRPHTAPCVSRRARPRPIDGHGRRQLSGGQTGNLPLHPYIASAAVNASTRIRAEETPEGNCHIIIDARLKRKRKSQSIRLEILNYYYKQFALLSSSHVLSVRGMNDSGAQFTIFLPILYPPRDNS
jgi:hypothetical protein